MKIPRGYIDCYDLCRSAGLTLTEWLPLYGGLIWETARRLELDLNDILIFEDEGDRFKCWLNPAVAIHVAMWCDPSFALQVSEWVSEILESESVFGDSRFVTVPFNSNSIPGEIQAAYSRYN